MLKRTFLSLLFVLLAATPALATDIEVSSFQVTGYQATGAPSIRVYYSETIVDSLGNVIPGGTAGTASFYKKVDCTLNSSTRVVTCPAFTLASTEDSSRPAAKVTIALYSGVNQVMVLFTWRVPTSLGATTTVAELNTYSQSAPAPLGDTYYTARHINYLLNLGEDSALQLAGGGTGATSFSGNQLIRANSGGTALESSGKTIADLVDITSPQTIGGVKNFSSTIVGSISGDAGNALAYKGVSTPSATAFGFISGLTSDAQAQLNNKQALDSDLTVIGGLSPSNDDLIQRKGGAWTNRTPAQFKLDLALVKGDVGLPNVDDTSDANKPVSTAQQTALNLKANLASPTFTGTVTLPSPFTLGATSVTATGTQMNFLVGVTSAIQTQLDAKQAGDADLTALAALASTGVMVRTAANTYTTRTLTGTANRITITNGDGVSGAPTFDIGSDVATLAGTETFSNKTLTAPKFADGGFIADPNGNEQIKFSTTASAVNELTVKNSASGSAVQIQTTGGDTNVSLNMVPKGSGAFQIKGKALPVPGTSATSNELIGVNAAGTDYETKSITAGSNITVTHSVSGIEISASVSAGSKWNQATNPDGNLALTMGNNTTTFTWGDTTGTSSLLKLQDTASNNGTGYVLDVEGASGTINVARFISIGGAGVVIDADGGLSYVGGGSINANFYKGVDSPTGTEFGYIAGLTSSAQSQLNAKASLISPSFTTPSLGVAAATSINKVAITAPTSSATLTIADGKTATFSNTLTFTGTDSSSVAFGAGGTVAYTANNLSVFAATTSAQLATLLSDENGTGKAIFSEGTLAIASGKTATFSNTLTIAGTDGSTLNVGAGGTLGSNAFTSTAYAPVAGPTFTGTVNFTSTPVLQSGGTTFLDASRNLTVQGFSGKYTLISATTGTLSDSDYFVIASNAAGATITLPTAVGRTGKVFIVKRNVSAAGNIVIDTTSAQTIDGAATKTLGSNAAAIGLISNGANWYVLWTIGTVT